MGMDIAAYYMWRMVVLPSAVLAQKMLQAA